MRKRLVLLASFLFGAGLAGSAQQLMAGQRDPRALAILHQCGAAMGTPDQQTTVTAEGQMVPASQGAPRTAVLIKSKGATSALWETVGPNGRETGVVHAGRGKVIRGAEATTLPSWHTKYTRQEHFPALACALESIHPSADVLYVGLEKVGDSSMHHIQISVGAKGKSKLADVSERAISDFHIFVDAGSFKVVKTMHYVFSLEAIENRSLYETYYTNYKQIGGVWMPFTITSYLAGQKLQDINFNKIELNTIINDSEFSK